MGFAEGYLQKHVTRQRLIAEDPDPELNLIVIIPCYNESGLLRSLDSLFLCDTTGLKAEIIIFINASESSSEAVLNQNMETRDQTISWIENHPHNSLRFHLLVDNSLPGKQAGVGLARKIVMDEAVGRFNLLNHPDGIILSFDADALVEPDYLTSVHTHFKQNPESDGCSIYFEHPVEGNEFTEQVYNAVSQYELHLRYYVWASRYTGYPFVFHTVGSSFAVKALTYCQHGGMNKRKAGEDFYFIQKITQNGRFSNCTTTCVSPSPRPSDRVPFGTGIAISKMLSGSGQPLKTYNPESFFMLTKFFKMMESQNWVSGFNMETSELHPVLMQYLMEVNFQAALLEIRTNSASPETFMKRFWRYFNMFRILKFVHFARDRGVEDLAVTVAAGMLLRKLHNKFNDSDDLMELLAIYRKLDRGLISDPLQ